MFIGELILLVAGADGKQKQVSETSPRKFCHVDGFCPLFLMTIFPK